jgi:hypothetical protein
MTDKQVTRRADAEPESWSIWYDDVCVGGISRLPGHPKREVGRWLWTCGFQPGGAPKDYSSGPTDTFEEARDQWQAAWEVYLPRRTDFDFEEWRQHDRFMADKMAGRLSPPPPGHIMECACGTTFDSHVAAEVLQHAGHIYRAQQARLGGW